MGMFTFLSLYDDTAALTTTGKKVGYNPPAINLYTATRLRTADASATWKDAHGVATAGPAADGTDSTARQTEMGEQKSQMWRHQINTDLSVNWASAPASGISALTVVSATLPRLFASASPVTPVITAPSRTLSPCKLLFTRRKERKKTNLF